MRLLLLIVGLTMSWTVQAQPAATIDPLAEGVPLPWPFPWAKDCDVEWKKMDGRYILSDGSEDVSQSTKSEEIDIKISVVSDIGFNIVRIFRYDGQGKLVAAGFNFAGSEQKMLQLVLVPMNRDDKPLWALIKLHYNKGFSCAQDQLVPILTLQEIPKDGNNAAKSEYRLVREKQH